MNAKTMHGRTRVAILLLLLSVTGARGQQSTIPWSIIDGGGGQTSSPQSKLPGSVGEPFVGKTSSSTTGLQGGFSSGLTTTGQTRYLAVLESWNLVSVPLTVPDYHKTVLYPAATSQAFAYQGSYTAQLVLANGVGYWLKFPSAQVIPMTGTVRTRDTIQVGISWNLIGSTSNAVNTNAITQIPPGIVQSSYYGYNDGYSPVTVLEPGSGYWVKAGQAGKLVLVASSIPPAAQSPEPLAGMGTIVIRDARGHTQRLYIGRVGDLTSDQYELPPQPPEGVFDARFASGRMVMSEASDRLAISGAAAPLTLSWELRDVTGVSLSIGNNPRLLTSSGSTVISDPHSPITLSLQNSAADVPKEYALSQNYPNPFNPSTEIRLQITDYGRVRLMVYDLLGRQVATLLDENRAPGIYTVKFDASNLSSGTYIYRLTAGGFTATHRMMLIK